MHLTRRRGRVTDCCKRVGETHLSPSEERLRRLRRKWQAGADNRQYPVLGAIKDDSCTPGGDGDARVAQATGLSALSHK